MQFATQALNKKYSFLSFVSFITLIGLAVILLPILTSTPAIANSHVSPNDSTWNVQFYNRYYDENPWNGAPCKSNETISTIPFARTWGSSGPGGGCWADTFSVRFERRFDFTGGTYRFHCHRDGFCRFSLPELGISHEADGGSFGGMDWKPDTMIPAGNHLVRIDYSHRQSNGDSRIELWWQGPEIYLPPLDADCTAQPQQWCGAYRLAWDSPSDSYVLRRLENTEFLNWEWGTNSPGYGIFEDFAAEWQRSVSLETGSYRFRLMADESARFKIINSEGKEVLNVLRNCCIEHIIDFDASAGVYKLVVNWLDSGGNATMKLSWEALATPTPTFTQVPPTNTFTFTPTEKPPTATFTFTPSPTYTPTPTLTATVTETSIPSVTVPFTLTPTPTNTDTPTSTATATLTETRVPSITATFTLTPTLPFTPTPTTTLTFTPVPTSDRALVLLYAALDNNLQANWTQLVNNIEAGVTESMDVRLYVDGPASNDAYIYDVRPDHTDNCPKRNDITCGGNYIVGTNLFVASEDSAAQMTLANFISQSVTLHPNASQLIVGLIGHGSGWIAGVLPGEDQLILDQPRPWNEQPRPWNEQPGALLWDDHPSPGPTKSHSLSIKALDNAFYWAQQVTGRPIDLLYMDGCSLGMVEIAYEVRNHARYMLASPNTDWTSFGYDNLLSVINPKVLNPLELGREWLRIDASVIRNGSNNYPYTYALVNLSKMESLKTAVNDLATRLIDQLPEHKGNITLAFSRADRYESDYNGLINEDDAYSDLKSFAIEVKSAFQVDSAMRQSANSVIDAISQAVVDKDHQSGYPPISDDYWGWDNYGGLGIYLPLVYDEERRRLYNQSEIIWLYENKWAEFLDQYLGQQTTASQTDIDRRPLLRCESTMDEQCTELASPLSLTRTVYLPLVSK